MKGLIVTALNDNELWQRARHYSSLSESYPCSERELFALRGPCKIHLMPDYREAMQRDPSMGIELARTMPGIPYAMRHHWLEIPGTRYEGRSVILDFTAEQLMEIERTGRGMMRGMTFPVHYSLHLGNEDNEYQQRYRPIFERFVSPADARRELFAFKEAITNAPRQRWYGRGVYDNLMRQAREPEMIQPLPENTRPEPWCLAGLNALQRRILESYQRRVGMVAIPSQSRTATEARNLTREDIDQATSLIPEQETPAEKKRRESCPLCKGSGVQAYFQVSGFTVNVFCDCRDGRKKSGPLLCEVGNHRGKRTAASHIRRAYCGREREPIRWHDRAAIERALSDC